MDEDRSARLALPLLHAGQAQKEMDHNEALALLDIAVQAGVMAAGTNTPPGTPLVGQCWIIGAAPEAAWSGRAGQLAGWTGGGWRFVVPTEGMAVWCAADKIVVRYVAGTWRNGVVAARVVEVGGVQVVGSRQSAVPLPSGGATIDQGARDAIAAIVARLATHGLIAG